MTELDAASLYVIRRHLGLKDIYGDAPAAVEAARAYFSKHLNYVSKALSASSRYVMGEKFNGRYSSNDLPNNCDQERYFPSQHLYRVS
jgi:hypothetical protein